MLPALKNNSAAGYQSPVKIELLKGAGLLFQSGDSLVYMWWSELYDFFTIFI